MTALVSFKTSTSEFTLLGNVGRQYTHVPIQCDATLEKVNDDSEDWRTWCFLWVLLIAVVGREMIRARPVKPSNVLLLFPRLCFATSYLSSLIPPSCP